MTYEYEHIFRVQLLGCSSVGFPILSSKFLSPLPEFKDSTTMTDVLFSRYSHLSIINDKTYELQIWIPKRLDYQELLLDNKSLYPMKSFFENANGIILMYDINSLKSFNSLTEYIQLIKKNKINIPMLLVGNKGDKEEKREVKLKQATNLAEQYNLSDFIEIMVKNRQNVDVMFEKLTKLMLENFDQNIWSIVNKYIWYDKSGFPHFDGDNVSEEDYDIIYQVYHPLRCTYCWMKNHCSYYTNLEDCEVHSWFRSKDYKNAKKD